MKLYKLTNENSVDILKMWVRGENRDRTYFYHRSHISKIDLESKAFAYNIIVNVEKYKNSDVLKTIKFDNEIPK